MVVARKGKGIAGGQVIPPGGIVGTHLKIHVTLTYVKKY